jgi:general secretion pathway protein D
MTPYVVRTDEHVAWLNMRESERMHWCLADVANIHGNAQHFTSSGDAGINTPTIFPDVTPAPEGLIAPEQIGAGTTSPWINTPGGIVPVPGDPNYLPPVPANAAPPSAIQPGYLPVPPPPPQVPIPTAAPNQSSQRGPTPAFPTPAPTPPGVAGAARSILPPNGPLQALPQIPQGPPGQVAIPQPFGPQPMGPQPYAVQPAVQPTGPPWQQPLGPVAPANYIPQGTNPNYTPLAR